ncbi:Variant Surface Glycoprotein, putative [Trypanosoma equiperdum]|uniref:Variant Surface Glycoprotein, putative n=1 Tax=Trypanosoma equiperdum TaxID=5694 RepID=A0A1G4I9Y6_TRYEQ|nr:Variant Surface Glycoprotein, putative [Trypanosoma equiperdum]
MPPLPQRRSSHLQVAIFIAIVLTTHTARGNVAQDDNVRERGALCGLIELANGRAKLESTTSQLDTDLADLLELNMSLADSSWLDIFRQPDAREKPRDFPQADFKQHEDWPGKWPKWKRAAELLLKPNGDEAVFRKHSMQGITANQRLAIKGAVARVAAEAEAIASLVQAEAPESDILTDEKLKELINQQVYGESPATEPPAASTKLFGTGANGGRTTSCSGTAADNKAVTVAGALICLCVADNTAAGNTDKACEYQTGLTNKWTDGNAPNTITIAGAIKLCDLKSETTLTSELLKARIAAVTALLARRTNAGTLGKTINGGCDGKQTGGMCLKYTDLGTSGTGKVTDIPWISGLSAIGSQLKKHEQAVQIRKEAARQLKAKKQLVRTLLYTERHGTAQAPQPAQSVAKPTTVTENCTAIQNAAACKQAKPNCEWKGSDDKAGPHCKLSAAAAEQQATKAGTGDAGDKKDEGEKDKCSAAKTPEDCAKVQGPKPEGKKAVCGWIDYIEGTGPVTPGCRSSSFLVEKKLALISAAFLALLF